MQQEHYIQAINHMLKKQQNINMLNMQIKIHGLKQDGQQLKELKIVILSQLILDIQLEKQFKQLKVLGQIG